MDLLEADHPLSLIEAVFVHLYVRHDIGRQIILLDISFLSYLPRNFSLGALRRHHAVPFFELLFAFRKKVHCTEDMMFNTSTFKKAVYHPFSADFLKHR